MVLSALASSVTLTHRGNSIAASSRRLSFERNGKQGLRPNFLALKWMDPFTHVWTRGIISNLRHGATLDQPWSAYTLRPWVIWPIAERSKKSAEFRAFSPPQSVRVMRSIGDDEEDGGPNFESIRSIAADWSEISTCRSDAPPCNVTTSNRHRWPSQSTFPG